VVSESNKKMQCLKYTMFETIWGWMAVAGSESGVRFATLPEETPLAAMVGLTRWLRCSSASERPELFDEFQRQTVAYLAGERRSLDVALDFEGAPPFFRQAWEACLSIPPGEIRSYGWLAAKAGRPAAVRAAGQAMARNWVPLAIPCHRVVASDGSLHGFGGAGLGLKARLLELERSAT